MRIVFATAVIALTTSALNLNQIEDNDMQYAEVALQVEQNAVRACLIAVDTFKKAKWTADNNGSRKNSYEWRQWYEEETEILLEACADAI